MYNTSNPFDWGGEVIDGFKTTAVLRNASYTEAAEAQFTGQPIDSFFGNDEAPSPQINRICGIECPEA